MLYCMRELKNLLYEQVGRIGKALASPKRLELIEKQIPELQQGFAARTRDQLEAARSEIMASVHEQASA